MKKVLLISFAVFLVAGAWAQEEELSKRELRRLQREQRKAEQKARLAETAAIMELMVKHQHFVLEADYLSNRSGARVPVQSNINFIMVDSTKGVVQFGSAQTMGYNGVGGMTVEGQVRNYRQTATGRNKDNWSVSFSFSSATWGNLDITLAVSSSGTADATIRGNWGATLNYHGRMVPLAVSRTYQGNPLR